jgi:hypothetical protein
MALTDAERKQILEMVNERLTPELLKLVREARAAERQRWARYCDMMVMEIEAGRSPRASAVAAFRSMAASFREAADPPDPKLNLDGLFELFTREIPDA